jgi:membrane fusion protein (multidrug efflux system)
MKFKFESNRKWLLVALIPVIAACGNQGNQVNNELAIPVSVTDVMKRSIVQYINTTGTATAASQATLYTEMAGIYRLVKNPRTGSEFKLGDIVEKGQVIVRLENPETQNTIAINTKKLNLDISGLENQKQKSLYEKGGVTLRELKNSEVQLAQATTDYENAKIQLAKMDVIAPFRGAIVDLPQITSGTHVNANTAVFTLMDYSKLLMEINLPEKNITTIHVGQEVSITNYTLPKDTLKAKINELSPVVSTETRTFKGKLLIDNPELKLRPGMFVKADIEVARRDSVIVISKDIIVSGNRGKTVYIVEKGAARDRIITTGLENETMVEVLEGLKKNDRIVTKGFETLRGNSKVKIINQ